MYYFTSDAHFGDQEILDVIPRPFRDVEEMDVKMIRRFNERVKPDDTTFFLGDFRQGHASRSFDDLYKLLNGHKVFVRGNHDIRNKVKAIITHLVIEHYGKRILLIHDPKDAYKYMADVDIVFHGHVHTAWKFRTRMVNVGVDQWNYFPVSIKTALNMYDRWARKELN